MKFLKIGLLTLVTFVFYSISFSQAPTASGNVMNFSSVASYEPYAEVGSTWSSLRTIAQVSSTLTTLAEEEGMNEVINADTLYPDFLKEVLNTDYIFQIGDYLIKIDLVNDRGLMIEANIFHSYVALVNNNLSATGMMVLDGDEDFGLELLEALANNTTSSEGYQSFLNEERVCGGGGRETDLSIPEWLVTSEDCTVGQQVTTGKTYGMDNKLVYQKFIVYFSLQSKIRSVWRCTFAGSWTGAEIFFYVDLKLDGTAKYRKRCGAEVNLNEAMNESYYSGGDGILNWRPYSGGRSLSHYDFNVDFAIRPAQDRTANPLSYFTPRHYRIVYGY